VLRALRGGGNCALVSGAAPSLNPMFNDEGPDGWGLDELVALDTRRLRRVEKRPTAVALRGCVGEGLGGEGLTAAGRAAVTGLAAHLPARVAAQAPEDGRHRGLVVVVELLDHYNHAITRA
jgi:hypothetical protein